MEQTNTALVVVWHSFTLAASSGWSYRVWRAASSTDEVNQNIKYNTQRKKKLFWQENAVGSSATSSCTLLNTLLLLHNTLKIFTKV